MKKSLFILSLLGGLFVQNHVNAGILPHKLKLLTKTKSIKPMSKMQNDYADFSGHWEGTCTEDAEEFDDELNISVSPDLSVISLDNTDLAVDAISSQSKKLNLGMEETIVHLRWREDGQALIGSMMGIFKYSNFSLGELISINGNLSISLHNEQLVTEYNYSFFKDGTLFETTQSKCIYSRK